MNKNVILANLPYWDPLVPPMGIARIKMYLQGFGYKVKVVDLNVLKNFKDIYKRYFDEFEKYIPSERRGNFFNIGHDVLQDQMTAHTNYSDEAEYRGLVKIAIENIFFCDVTPEQVNGHIEIMTEFYRELELCFTRLLENEKPGAIGLTVYKANLGAAMFVFKLSKQMNPNIKTVMGGGIFADTMAWGSPNLEFFRDKTKEYIDLIMIGSGEHFMLKALRDELPKKQRVFLVQDLANDAGAPSGDVFPDLTDLDLQHYPYIVASSSTSCPFECKFCNSSIFYGEYRKKDITKTADHMINLQQTYNSRLFFMSDALLNPTIDELAQELADRDAGLYFDGYFRIDENSCDVEKTLHWRRGGFYRARLGIESGSQKILDLMSKQITVEHIRKAAAGLSYAGIKATGYFVIGYPGETEEDFLQTLQLLSDIRNDIWQAECVPFAYYYNGQPGSDIWAQQRKLLYPETARDMLIAQTWIIDRQPTRKERYSRVFRFSRHCRKLGIPNPYSLSEIYAADQRWQKLHRNAVPPLVTLMDANQHTGEAKNVKKLHFSKSNRQYAQDFAF